jgi:multidrug efflux system membrane fusion protein
MSGESRISGIECRNDATDDERQQAKKMATNAEDNAFSGEPKATACSRRTGVSALVSGLGAGLALALLAAGCKKESGGAEPAPPAPVVPVTLAPVLEKTVPVEFRNFGTVQPFFSAAVKSQVTGILQTVHFRKGQEVKKGDRLFTIDPRPYEAALKQAEANLARETAQFQNAQKEAERQAELLKKGFTAQDAYDQARTTADALAAGMKADAAAIDTARLNLDYCYISSPIDGKAGDYLVDPGNLVKAQDVTMVIINQVRPIEVSFSLPQKDLLPVLENMAKRTLTVLAIIPGAEARPEQGELTFVNNSVDAATGTFQCLGTFANKEGRLWPGLYVNVVLTVAEERGAIVIPSRAVQVGQKGSYVWVVTPEMTAEARPVTVARALDGDSVISSGLKAGEQVVVDGQLRLVPGARVRSKPAVEAPKEPRP